LHRTKATSVQNNSNDKRIARSGKVDRARSEAIKSARVTHG